MPILYVTDVAGLGGAEKRLLTLARRLDRVRFAPSFVSLAPGGPLLERLRAMGFRAWSLDVRRAADHGPALGRLVASIRRAGVRVVHGQIRYSAFLAALAGRVARAEAVVATRTYTTRLGGHPRLDAFTSKLAHVTVAVSEAAAGELPRGTRVAVIPNGVDAERFAAAAPAAHPAFRGARVILSVGNMHAIKGQAWLLRAMPSVLAAHPDARLVLVGDGPLAGALRAEARAIGLADRAVFLGFEEDVAPFLRAAHLFVLPSLNEGMSNALLEAMAAGLPVVATRAGGNPETVGDAGLLVPAADPGRLAEAIARLLARPEEARALGERAARRARERFSESAMVDRYASLYERLLARRRDACAASPAS